MKKKLLFLSPLAFLLTLLLILPVTQAASNPADSLAPDAPAAPIGGGQWDRIWRGSGALYDFDCATPDLCFAVGEDGMTLKTANHGQSWHQEILEGGHDLHGVSANGNLLLAAGDSGVIYRSANAGLTWQLIDTPTGSNLEAISLVTDGSSHAWAVGAGGVILHSVTGGQTWSVQTSNTPNPLHAVQFVNATTGYAAGEKGLLLKTTDGGTTWTPISNTFPGWARINAMTFIDADTGWIAGQAGYIRKTTDGGQTWQEIDSGVGVDIFSIHLENGFGVLGGARGTIATSPDGVTWTKRASIVQDERDVTAVFARGEGDIWAAGTIKSGSSRAWFVTRSNDGVTFAPVAGDYGAQPVLQEAATPSKDVAYVAGSEGAIGKTIDGGDTWSWQHFRSKYGESNITTISCPTVDSCWIAGQVTKNPGFVYVTHDGGQSWTFQSTSDQSNWPWMYDIEMLDEQNGHAAANPDMFYTTDGGVTWQKSAVVGNTANVDISMASRYEGWTAQRNLGHRYTTSGGKQWQRFMPYNEQASIYFFGVDTLDVNQDGGLDMGWLVGCQGPLVDEQCPANSGVIFYAVGHQYPGYAQHLPANTPQLYTITMLDDRHGWVGGAQGTLLYTENGGAIWREVDSHTSNLITDIAFYKNKIGYASTYGGEILRFRGPGRDLSSFIQSTPIVVDGEIFDWHYGGGLYLDADNASTVLGDEPYPTPEQLSGEFYSRWTDDTLYIMAQIDGDELIQNSVVLLALDGLNNDVWNPESNDDDLLILIASNGDFESGSPANNAAIAHAVKYANNHWQMELGIPARLLGRIGLAQNDAVGMNLSLSSSHEDGSNMHMLLLSGRSLADSPATWGRIRLLGETLTLQNGLNDYKGTEDTYLSIWDNEPGNIVHGNDDVVKTIFTTGRPYANILIHFDFSQLPEKAIIEDASLAMYAPSTGAREGFQVAAYRLMRPWEEATATWLMADASTPWAQGGALKAGEDYDPTPLDTVPIPIGFRNDWLTWNIRDAIAYWGEHPDENYGVLLKGVNGSLVLSVYSTEYNAMAEQRPKLLVDFSLQARPTPTPTPSPTPTPPTLYLPLFQR